MLEIDGRALRVIWTVFLFALVVALLYSIRSTLVVFLLAVFLAHLLGPLVNRVERWLAPRIPRTLALAIVYLVLVGGALAVLIPVGAKIGEQAAALASKLPDALQQDPLGRLPLPWWLEQFRPDLTDKLRTGVEDLGKTMLPVLKEIGTSIVAGLGNLLAVVLIPVLSFFFLKDGQSIRDAIIAAVPEAKRDLAEEILAGLHLLVAQYIRALVLLAMVSFAAHSLFLEVAGVPYPILLAGIAGILEFIPVVGPLVSASVILLVAVFSGYPHLLWIVIFLIVFRMFQDYVVSPHLMSSGVEIHPLLVLFGVLAGEQVAGIPGMFFSVPAMAALRVVVVRVRRQRVA
jgi:predicted PurR-regulated permease PerM